MKASKNYLRTSNHGHNYYKRSDCPVCPVCEKENKPTDKMLSLLVAPARRALESKGIRTLHQLSKFSESDLAKRHGMGLSTIAKRIKAMKSMRLTFKK